MNDILLSAALIVRNEARHVGDCLASLAGIADEVVVVDTGSTDDTKAIAERHGARVSDFPWCDDFSAARNRALELARGSWILYIDADERAGCADPAALREQLRDPRFVGLWVRFHVHPDYTPYQELRLFRNDPSIRFEGVIHETMWPSVIRHLKAGNGQVAASALEIAHLGYVGDLAHKVARNLPLLERAVTLDPDRVYLWCELGKAYDALDRQADAARAFRRAVSVARAHAVPDATDNAAYTDAIRWRTLHGRPADRLLADALRRFPNNAQLLWSRACRLMDRGDFHAARAVLHNLLAGHERRAVDPTVAYDRRIFGAFGLEALATCDFKLGRYADAARHFSLALAEQPDNADLRGKAQMAERLALAGEAAGPRTGPSVDTRAQTLRVGIYDRFFRPGDPSMTLHQPLPEDFEYVDACDDPARVDVVLATYANLADVLRSTHPRRVYYLQETTEARPPYDEHRYPELSLILTNDERVVARHTNAAYLPFVGTWITDFTPTAKTAAISFIASALTSLSGHRLRHEVARDPSIMKHVHSFGAAFNRHVADKREALAPYRFSITIENARYAHYATEKLFDCFATATIPVYWGGAGRLADYGFDPDGILEWSTIDELREHVARLTRSGEEIYAALTPAVERNRRRAEELRCHETLLREVLLAYCRL